MNEIEEKKLRDKYSHYMKVHDKLENRFVETSNNLDKLIFGISSGTIVLSITFIDRIVTIQNVNFIWLLYISWILLVCTLLINLLTHLLVMASTKKGLKVIQKWIEKIKLDIKCPDYNNNAYGKASNIFNIISIILLISGVILLIFFTSINIENQISNTKAVENNYNIIENIKNNYIR